MSFIDLKLVIDHGRAQGMLKPGDMICPILSAVSITQAPMESEPGLMIKGVICAESACGMFRKCFNLPPEVFYDTTSPIASPNP